MNLNQLANAMKPAFLPGEALRVKVIQEGKEPGQGVGYLDDGTMIVVEGGSSYLQRELEVHVTRVLQTVAGRMVFAQPDRGRLSRICRACAPGDRSVGHHVRMRSSSGGFADAVIVAAGFQHPHGRRRQVPGDHRRPSGAPVGHRRDARRDGRPAGHRGHRRRPAGRAAGARPGSTDNDVAVVAGGARRQDSVARGVRARRRGCGARPRRGPAARHVRAHRPGRRGRRAARRCHPRCCRSSTRSKQVRDGRHHRHRRPVDCCSGHRRPRVPDVSCCTAALDAFADGPDLFGDEQELLARHGVPVVTVPGEAAALKITEPIDLDVVRALAAGDAGAGRPSGTRGARTATHSAASTACAWPASTSPRRLDCTVTPTATWRSTRSCDGLLAAARLGDLGRLFPAGDAATRGVDSRELLRQVVARLGPGRPAAGVAGPDHRGRPSPARRRPPGADAGHPRGPAGYRRGGRRGPGVHRQPVGRRGRRPDHQRLARSWAWCRHDAPLPQHPGRRARAVRAARRRERAHVHLRPDGLRTRPRGQLPELRVRRPDPSLPGLEGLPGDVGHEHHGRRRQDHPRRGRRGHHHRRADGGPHRGLPGRAARGCG